MATSDATGGAARKAGSARWLMLALALGGVALALAVSAQRGDDEPEEVETVELPPGPAPEGAAQDDEGVERLRVEVLRRLPHARDAFTQGLLWHAGKIYESTGQYGRSTIRRVDLVTGDVELRTALDDAIFAEGLARVGDRFVQLSWQNGKAYVWRETESGFSREAEHDYAGEGWGLCHDGDRLVMSDGSATLTFRHARNFAPMGDVLVTHEGRSLRNLNELECVVEDGQAIVYANVWQRDTIVRIDPATGRVVATVDASGLLRGPERYGTDVLNGIAWLPESETFLITGKLWPAAFEVRFVPAGS